jgi:hypothetical protein
VRVVSTEIQAIIAAQILESYPNVSLDLLKHMAEVQIAICIGKGAGNENFTGSSHRSLNGLVVVFFNCVVNDIGNGYLKGSAAARVAQKKARTIPFSGGRFRPI